MGCACPLCGSPIVDDDRVLVDFDGGLIVARGQIARLTKQEFALFEALWSARPRMLNKERLLAATAGTGFDDRELKIIDVFVCKARKKLEPLGIAIETVWGAGYRITTGKDVQE